MSEVAISVLDVDEENATDYFYNLETAKPDYFHIDVMDGKFVKKDTVDKMRNYSNKLNEISMTPMDVHLMVENPKDYFDDYLDLAVDRISFHIEACKNKEEVFNNIKILTSNGIKAGIAVNPDTDIEKIYEFLPYLHFVVIMSVVPGLGGQKFMPSVLVKIDDLKKYCLENNFDIDVEVDGGINNETCKDALESGADILVSGNYILKHENFSDAVKSLKI